MLKNIPEIISPELMMALMQMGHGDELVLGDINFPSYTMNNRCIYAKGWSTKHLMDAILQLMPLDSFSGDAVTVMQPAEGNPAPAIWQEYEAIIRRHDFARAFKKFHQIERTEFCNRAKNSFVTVQTSEPAPYSAIILRKGMMG